MTLETVQSSPPLAPPLDPGPKGRARPADRQCPGRNKPAKRKKSSRRRGRDRQPDGQTEFNWMELAEAVERAATSAGDEVKPEDCAQSEAESSDGVEVCDHPETHVARGYLFGESRRCPARTRILPDNIGEDNPKRPEGDDKPPSGRGGCR